MIGCDACDGWEHLSCRGLLKAPPEEEAHTCHGCLKTNNPDLKVCVIGNNIHNTISICTDVMLEKEGTRSFEVQPKYNHFLQAGQSPG